jgi:hypothetical protein
MDSRVRRVIARYYAEPAETQPDSDKSWIEYLDDKSKSMSDPNSVIKEMLKGKTHLNSPFNTTNPYDYESPSDAPKDQKDSPPFENNVDQTTQRAQVSRPDMYGENGDMAEWWRSRREDYTTDEEEQRPAMSLTRKYSSGVIPEELLTRIVVSSRDFFKFAMISKVAASLTQILNIDSHKRNRLKLERSRSCRAEWSNKNNPNQYNKGLFTFKVTTPGSPYGPHNVYLQFLRNDNIDVNEYVDYPVHVGCTCPDFLYSGAQYYAVQGGYMYMPAFKPDLVAPKSEDQFTISVSPRFPNGRKNYGKGKNARVCKHILAVFDVMKNTPIEYHYKEYPLYSPPSAKIDKDAWEKMMKFPFTEKEIKDRLLSSAPKVPGYFQRESVTPVVIDWFNNTWFPRTDDQKLKSLKEFRMFPERVYFFLIEEAYLKRQHGEYISKRLVDEGYQLMSEIIDENNPAEGQVILENDDGTIGTGKPDIFESGAPEEEKAEDIKEKKPGVPRARKQYGVPSEPKKVKQPGKLKRPSQVQPAIK